MNHMHISGNEPSSVILRLTKTFKNEKIILTRKCLNKNMKQNVMVNLVNHVNMNMIQYGESTKMYGLKPIEYNLIDRYSLQTSFGTLLLLLE